MPACVPRGSTSNDSKGACSARRGWNDPRLFFMGCPRQQSHERLFREAPGGLQRRAPGNFEGPGKRAASVVPACLVHVGGWGGKSKVADVARVRERRSEGPLHRRPCRRGEGAGESESREITAGSAAEASAWRRDWLQEDERRSEDVRGSERREMDHNGKKVIKFLRQDCAYVMSLGVAVTAITRPLVEQGSCVHLDEDDGWWRCCCRLCSGTQNANTPSGRTW